MHLFGGIAGRTRAYGLVSYCYNLGNVEHKGAKVGIGGISGGNHAYDGTTNVEERKSIISNCYNKADVISETERIGGISAENTPYCEVKNCYIYSGAKIQYNGTDAADNIGSLENNYLGKIIGKNSTGSIEENNGILDEMPTVYYVVNGLNDGKSEYWSNANPDQPKLLWEK